VYAVNTGNGVVETPIFVDASGIWTGTTLVKTLPYRHVRTAAYPCTYSYIHSTKLPTGSVSDTTPIFNDLDGKIMIRATGFKTLCAGFLEEGIRPLARQGATHGVWHHPEPDWDLFSSALEKLLFRCPTLGEIEHGDLICGMESYTPDKAPTVGHSTQAQGYYVINGFNGQGLSLAGGTGEMLADWICDGMPKLDVANLDVARFLDSHANAQYLMERVPEVASMTYSNMYNSHQCHTARNIRMSPIYHQLRDAGAVFATNDLFGMTRSLNLIVVLCSGVKDSLIGKPIWFDEYVCQIYFLFSLVIRSSFSRVATEYEACRERVGLIDMSSFAKFDITGPDVVRFLQYLCSANIDRDIGTTIYSGMQHERGGYVTDCTLSRLSETSYFMVAPTIQQERCTSWMKYWATKMNVNVHIQDVTGMYTVLDVVGPSSRYLMADVTEMSMSTQDFPTFRCQEISIGMATGIRAISVTHCGELGWVIYIPNEVAQNVYERIVEAGREYSLVHSGYYALRQLRIEKFYVYWGQDINATVTPVECGRSFRVDFKKDFIGKEALEKQLERGVSKRFVQLLVDNHDKDLDPWPQGGEILFRDGKPVGMTTSAAYGFTLGCQVCTAYVENKEFGVSAHYLNKGVYELDIAGKRFPVRVNLHSPSLPMISSEHPLHYRPTQ
ncbi:glycine cleavage T-protein, partial [Ostertagia ostertagi]